MNETLWGEVRAEMKVVETVAVNVSGERSRRKHTGVPLSMPLFFSFSSFFSSSVDDRRQKSSDGRIRITGEKLGKERKESDG